MCDSLLPALHLLNAAGPPPAYGKMNNRLSAEGLGCGQTNHFAEVTLFSIFRGSRAE